MILSEFIISVVELIEAQFEEMRCSLHKSIQSASLVLLASMMALVGFIFALLGTHMLLTLYVGEIASYFITALMAFIITAVIFVLAKVYIRKRRY